MNIYDAMKFFKSWGMYPHDEETPGLNQEVIRQGINACCYNKLLDDASGEHGAEFAEYCARAINAQDDAFFLRAHTWDDVRLSWNDIDGEPDVTQLVREKRTAETCKCGRDGQEESECPYNEISCSEAQCNCCRECRQECREAI